MYGQIGGLLCGAGDGGTHHDSVHITVNGLDGVLPSLALGLRGSAGAAQIDAAGAHAVDGGLKAQAGAGAGLKEQRGNGHAGQILNDLAALDALFVDHRGVHDMAQLLIGKVVGVDNVAACKVNIGFHKFSS